MKAQFPQLLFVLLELLMVMVRACRNHVQLLIIAHKRKDPALYLDRVLQIPVDSLAMPDHGLRTDRL